ncbi:M24 family metallopeptidase [Xylophilus sp.]|uniref:M24 family metallopeptidase n=1 Tax=Xylophilus sp. TaxID=2653893 RepID=UPI0013B79F3F|nr:M24 family metallopeptidase [Xylophilus sp.]KAF1044489.1 MAG: Xaa-Pro dipeptidase [Xylophilus sp.]
MAFLTQKTRIARYAALQALQREQGLDALALLGEDFIEFYSNFHVDVRAWERPIIAVLPASGAPFAVFNELSTTHLQIARERASLWIEDVELYAEHPRIDGRLPLLPQWAEYVADRLRRAGLARARIGVDVAGGWVAKLGALLPEARFVPVTRELRALRWVKTSEELDILRRAASLADWIQERYRERLRPGVLTQVLDFELAAEGAAEAARRFPGEDLGLFTWTLSGARSASPHGDGASLGAKINPGDTIINIVIPRLNGLVVENERTWFAGQPSAEQARFFEVARAANGAAVAAAVVGRPVSGIDAAAQRVIEAAGLGAYVHHRTGHGIGLAGHEFPDDMAFNHRPLLAGEVYSAEPGLYAYGLGGFRIDDTVVVGEQPEVLTQTPRTLAHATLEV